VKRFGTLNEHSFESFCELVEQIKALGYDEETAANFAAIIGDTPCVDDQGRTVVIDEDGRELARLDLPE
jgi:hypothetical protein